jgi:hypothetical protein
MTYEEIKEKYPIGKILCSKTIESHQTRAWYTQEDIAIYKQKYQKVEVFPDNTCKCYQTDTYETKVEGWLFDGKKWRVVQGTWDGWVPYSEEELEQFEIDRLKREYLEDIFLNFKGDYYE